MISKHISLLTFLNEPKLLLFHIVKLFQVCCDVSLTIQLYLPGLC